MFLTNIPTRLDFTKVVIDGMDRDFFPDALKLVETCKYTVRKLCFCPYGEPHDARNLATNSIPGTCHAYRTSDFSPPEGLRFDVSWTKIGRYQPRKPSISRCVPGFGSSKSCASDLGEFIVTPQRVLITS